MRSIFVWMAACFSLTALAAPKYFIQADVVRGSAGAQGAVCVANSVFFPGEQVVWRAVVFDLATQARLSEEQIKQLGLAVTVTLENGANLNMRYGLHPPDPNAPKREAFWSTSYQIPADAPVGTLKWSMTAKDKDGNTGAFTPIGQDVGLAVLTIAKAQAAAPQAAAADGQALYGQYCASCHQANGQGLAGAFPPLAGSRVVTGDAAYLARVVLFGLQGPITVRGQNYDGNMPAFGSLSDAQVAAILTYVRSAWGNAAGAVSAATVQAERAKPGSPQDNHAKYPK